MFFIVPITFLKPYLKSFFCSTGASGFSSGTKRNNGRANIKKTAEHITNSILGSSLKGKTKTTDKSDPIYPTA